jgi:NADH-quinone oxidoreductase subunit J
VLTFFSLAAIYVLLGAHFIAAVQIIVYAGAIMVLFLFVIMLLNLGAEYHSDVRRGMWIVIGFVTAGIIGYALSRGLTLPEVTASSAAGASVDAAVRELGVAGAIGQPLFRDWIVPFELTSLLLLVAAIGAVLLAKRRI